jgi:DNA-binding response OmpR family regulator
MAARPKATVRLLIVEDEPKLAQSMSDGLRAEGYEVAIAATGEEAFVLACTEAFDLLLLDRMLPGRDGVEVLTLLRTRGIEIPAIVVTARDTVDDRVHGLERGADDYLVKPFAFSELVARVRALLRRGRSERAPKLHRADLEMDFVARSVQRAGRQIELTAREFDVLGYLMRLGERVASREMLARDVWKVTARATPLDNVIDVTMTRLRRKIDDGFDRKLLCTVRGVGFKLGSGS